MVRHAYLHKFSQCILQLSGRHVQVRPLIRRSIGWTSLILVQMIPRMGPPTLALIVREVAPLLVSRGFNLIFPSAEASSNYLEWGHRPSMKMLSWMGSLNPWVVVFWSSPHKKSRASLKDSSGNWWNEEISAFPSAVFDSGKYFFKKISTTSSQVLKLFPLNECSHLLASPTSEKDNKLSCMASSETPAIFAVLHISK